MGKEELTAFEKRLCNALQNGLPICERPYAQIAKALGSDEEAILKQTRELVRHGVIRRMGAVVNWRAVGKAGTLVTAHIEKEKLNDVVTAINELEGVSHNYLREHHYNLWWTLRADSKEQIEEILRGLAKRFEVEFNSLPAVRIFKLDVRFDAESEGRRLLSAGKTQDPRPKTQDIRRMVEMDEADRKILAGLQGGLEVVERPYDFLCGSTPSTPLRTGLLTAGKDGLQIGETLARIESMLKREIIYRVGAVVNHHKLCFTANAMFVCKAGDEEIADIGQKLAGLEIVSHCYERKVFEGWPYNLYAMMHGRNMTDIRRVVEKFVKAEVLGQWELLETRERLRE